MCLKIDIGFSQSTVIKSVAFFAPLREEKFTGLLLNTVIANDK